MFQNYAGSWLLIHTGYFRLSIHIMLPALSKNYCQDGGHYSSILVGTRSTSSGLLPEKHACKPLHDSIPTISNSGWARYDSHPPYQLHLMKIKTRMNIPRPTRLCFWFIHQLLLIKNSVLLRIALFEFCWLNSIPA